MLCRATTQMCSKALARRERSSACAFAFACARVCVCACACVRARLRGIAYVRMCACDTNCVAQFVSLTSPSGVAFLEQLRFAPGAGDGVSGVSITLVDDFSTRRAYAQLAVVLGVAGAAPPSSSDDEADAPSRARVRVAIACTTMNSDVEVVVAFVAWWNTMVEHSPASAMAVAEAVSTAIARGGAGDAASEVVGYDELRRVIGEATAAAVVAPKSDAAWLHGVASVTAAAFAQHAVSGSVKRMIVANGRVLVLPESGLFAEGDVALMVLHEFRWVRGRRCTCAAAAY